MPLIPLFTHACLHAMPPRHYASRADIFTLCTLMPRRRYAASCRVYADERRLYLMP